METELTGGKNGTTSAAENGTAENGTTDKNGTTDENAGGRNGTADGNAAAVQSAPKEIQLQMGRAPYAALTPEEDRKLVQGNRWFALLMLLIGFLYSHWIFDSVFGLGVGLFTLAFCTASIIYMYKNGFRQTKTSLFYLGIVGLSAVNFALLDNEFIGFLNLLFLQVMAAYWVCVSTGRRIGGGLSAYVLGDGVSQTLLVPFGNFGRHFAALFTRPDRKKKELSSDQKEVKKNRRMNLLFAAAGLLVMLPLLIIVINLLTSADAAFEDLIGRIHFSFHFTFPENWLPYLLDFIIGIPVACYLFGLLFGNVTGRKANLITRQSFDKAAEGVRFLPKVMVLAGVGALIAVYLLFFATQAAYLFSAFRNSLPVTMTYAEYARRGFFELCTVAGINLTVIALANLFVERRPQERSIGLRTETAAVCVLTVMLIATAVSKMGMYIHYYGLTPLRFYTTAFMTLMFIGFIIIFVRQLKSFNCGKWLALLCMIGFLAITYSNADGLIAKYNIERFEAGTLDDLDLNMLAGLSDAAVMPMYELYMNTEDDGLKEKILTDFFRYEEYGGFPSTLDADYRGWNYQRWQAKTLIDSIEIK